MAPAPFSSPASRRPGISPPGGPLDALDDEQAIKFFPRVIYSNELPEVGAKDHFVFPDLVDRARAIAIQRSGVN